MSDQPTYLISVETLRPFRTDVTDFRTSKGSNSDLACASGLQHHQDSTLNPLCARDPRLPKPYRPPAVTFYGVPVTLPSSAAAFGFSLATCDLPSATIPRRSVSAIFIKVMGRPILKICAMRGCEETDCTDPVHNAGVDFSVESCLAKDVSLSAESQVRLNVLPGVWFRPKSCCRLRHLTQRERHFCSFGRAVQSTRSSLCNWFWTACRTEILNTSLNLTISLSCAPWARSWGARQQLCYQLAKEKEQGNHI